MSYVPNPIDTSLLELPPGVLALTERLAEHIHNVWAKARMDEGWRYGPTRDDEKKEHPCLVPYDELPESEREYDRNTALESIRSIVAVGYRIEPAIRDRCADTPGAD